MEKINVLLICPLSEISAPSLSIHKETDDRNSRRMQNCLVCAQAGESPNAGDDEMLGLNRGCGDLV